MKTKIAIRPATTPERILACVGPSPTSAEIVRAAGRLALECSLQWTALHVRTPRSFTVDDDASVASHLRLAESLGATTAIVEATDAASEIVRRARQDGCTRILIGKTGPRRWVARIRPCLVDRVIVASEGIDVLVVRSGERVPTLADSGIRVERASIRRYVAAMVVSALGTILALTCDSLGLSEANLVLAHVLAVAVAAATCGSGPAVVASLMSILSFNYFFTSPRRTFVVDEAQYLFTFAVMLLVGLIISSLAIRVRRQSKSSRARQDRADRLHDLSRRLSATSGVRNIAGVAADELKQVIAGRICIHVADTVGGFEAMGPDHPPLDLRREIEEAMARAQSEMAAARSASPTGDTRNVVGAPLVTPQRVVGILTTWDSTGDWTRNTDDARFVALATSQLAFALARDLLDDEMRRTLAEAEAQRLRSALLNSISHDLRTPLSSILGAATSLISSRELGLDHRRMRLVEQIRDESARLSRIVDNLLQMTRIESGRLELTREWHVVDDLVGSAVNVTESRLVDAQIGAKVDAGLPLVRVDGVLIELALTNLIENAVKYSPPGAEIRVVATRHEEAVSIAVIDQGPGLSHEDLIRAFEKFYRGHQTARPGHAVGAGLGLCIADAVARLHGGEIAVENLQPRGACFELRLPIEQQPPVLEVEAADTDRGDVS